MHGILARTPRSTLYDPLFFSVDEARARVTAAMRDKASVGGGELQYVRTLGGFGQGSAADVFGPARGKGVVTSAKPLGPGLECSSAVQSVRAADSKDDKLERLCANCGSPHNLKVGRQGALLLKTGGPSRQCGVAAYPQSTLRRLIT